MKGWVLILMRLMIKTAATTFLMRFPQKQTNTFILPICELC